MKILPLAADSFGTRSMATYIATKDIKILIDPCAALGPSRYNLGPHPREEKRLKENWREIRKYVKKAGVLIVTHYHYDHYNPEKPELYKNKIVYLKHPTDKINLSQKKRSRYFLNKLGNLPKSIEYSDGKEFKFGKTKIKFSKAVFHGASNKLGYVTEVLIDDGKTKFIHTSDVQGPVTKKQTDFIIENNPDILYLDGPLSYMLGFRFSYANLKKAVSNLIKIIEKTKVKTIIIDHHFLRDKRWQERIGKAIKVAERKKIKIMTAAEFTKKKLEMLEAYRNVLWKSSK